MEVCVGLLGEETRSNIEEKALESSYRKCVMQDIDNGKRCISLNGSFRVE
jgi:hypothetical protein